MISRYKSALASKTEFPLSKTKYLIQSLVCCKRWRRTRILYSYHQLQLKSYDLEGTSFSHSLLSGDCIKLWHFVMKLSFVICTTAHFPVLNRTLYMPSTSSRFHPFSSPQAFWENLRDFQNVILCPVHTETVKKVSLELFRMPSYRLDICNYTAIFCRWKKSLRIFNLPTKRWL